MTQRAAVLGHPIGHSLSPMIHNYWIGKYGLAALYEAIDVPQLALQDTVSRLADLGYAGFNVTLPHKETMLDLCHAVDDVAQAIGAVNTVRILDGKLHGTNTDAFGFIANLREQQPQWNPAQGSALVLGAGGAARAVLYGLLDAGVPEIMLCNRTLQRAHDLTVAFPGTRVIGWEEKEKTAQRASLIVNTTSLGMKGQDPLHINLMGAQGIVYDIVYRPLITPLLAEARRHALPVVTGLGMLLHQARPAFASWFGTMPDVDETIAAQAARAAGVQ